MIDNTNTNTVTSNPVVNVTQTATVSVNVVSALQTLLYVDSDLKVIEELMEDFKDDHREQAAKSETELRKLEREIKRLRSDISELGTNVIDSSTSESKMKPICERIKERWDKLADMSKQCYYVIGFAEKINKISSLMISIDWHTLLK